MDAFGIRRVEPAELPTIDSSRDWYVLNSKICGVPVGKFLSNSPLVANFPSEFATVHVADIRNGAPFDGRVQKGEVAVASTFGVVSAILRQKIKTDELDHYKWIVNAVNAIKMDEDPPSRPAFAISDQVQDQDKQRIFHENQRLKEDLEVSLARLDSLREELEKFASVKEEAGDDNTGDDSTGNSVAKERKEEESPGDVWTLISDVCDRYQVSGPQF